MIHRGNYEEFFILYMDNELNEQERVQVDAFLIANPDLKVELDLLMSTKLPADVFPFPAKASLSAESMNQEKIQESILYYIDGELPEAEKKNIEVEISTNKAYQEVYTLLSKAKLSSSEIIPYPNKKELYRHSEKVISAKTWLRIASAIILIAFSSVLIWNTPAESEVNTTVSKKAPVDIVQPKTIITELPLVDNKSLLVQEQKTGSSKNHSKTPVIHKQQNAIATATEVIKKTPIENSIIPVIVSKKEDLIASNTLINTPTEKIPVTPSTPGTSNNSDPSTSIVTGGEESKERKGSLKGFLRKATRLIERNTGIGIAKGDITNENDEILIGAIAVKLNNR